MEEIGKFLRMLRIFNDESAKTMAEKICVSPSYLSAVELGKRVCPKDWEEKILKKYQLKETEKQQLHKLINNSQRKKRKIPLGQIDKRKSYLITKIVDTLDDSTIEELCAIVEVKQKKGGKK